MFIIKKILQLFVLLFPVLSVFSQASVTISEYGTYFINNGIIRKIPVTEEVGGGDFWRNYIILHAGTSVFIYLYNMENGALSDIIYPMGDKDRSGFVTFEKIGFFPIEREGNNNLLFYYNGLEFELDPVTLRTVRTRVYEGRENIFNSLDMKDRNVSAFVHGGWLPRQGRIRWEYESAYISRYYGENFYFVVTLSQNLNPVRNMYISGSLTNQFVFSIHDRYDTGR